MATEIITSFQQICDASGNPVSGAEVSVYDVGTTTPRAIFSDTGLAVPADNPIICNSSGRADMRYTATGSYKIIVRTAGTPPGSANGTTVYTRDNIDGRVPVGSGALAIANGGTGQTTGSAALTALGGATAAELADVAAEVAALSGVLASSEKTHIATGSTAQRPATPVEGDIRRNTTNSDWEGYNGTTWDEFAVQTDTRFTLPTIQVLTSGTGATYTRPAGVRLIRVRMVGGGGGGGGASANNGTNGGVTSFESWTADNGDGGLAANLAPGAGGSGGASGTGTQILRYVGARGGGSATDSASIGRGGGGGPTPFGAGVVGLTLNATAGTSAPANSGAGGSGGSSGAQGGGGGGAGEYVEFRITSPSTTYTYTIGAGGAGGAAGGQAGGNGGSGIIIVDEYY